MKHKFFFGAIIGIASALIFSAPLFSSDRSDAEGLRERCEREFKPLEVSVANFGDQADKAMLQKGEKKLKLGKLKIAQSRYKDAIGIYNGYLKLQWDVYMSIAKKYVDRTRAVNDEIAEDLVDSIDKPKVSEYLKLAYRNLEDAKKALANDNPVLAINACRRSKKYSIGAYGLVGRPVPEKFKADFADAEGNVKGK
jgi:hypothetical protein